MLNNIRIYLLVIFSVLFCSSVFSADDVTKYVAVHKEGDVWKVVSVTDTIPTYKSGMEIISLPDFQPKYVNDGSRSSYGGYDCPIVADESIYDLCNSYFYSFIGANWFGLGGKRVDFRQGRFSEVKEAISADPTVAKLLVEYKTAAAERAAKAEEIFDKIRRHNDEILAKSREQKEKAEKEAREIAIAKVTQMERGSEDSCRRIIKDRYEKYLSLQDPIDAKLICQFGGSLNLSDMKAAGWIVISRQKDDEGIVNEYLLRKSR